MKRYGFTLIELLIVVAIIAILAAIAVPNFLEAQTRSRVSRAQNDLRTISLGMESYRIDNNTYPADYSASPLEFGLNPHSTSTNMDNRLLTTPVSYMSQFPSDIFRIMAGVPQNKYRIYSIAYTSNSTATDKVDYHAFPKTAWMTWSLGPDKLTNTGGYFSQAAVIRNEASSLPRIGTDENGKIINGTSTYAGGMRYDPTNGTTSFGDIYRWEGESLSRYN